MTATRQLSFVQRSTAFALAAAVTLALLASLDALATQDLNANALLAQQTAAAAPRS